MLGIHRWVCSQNSRKRIPRHSQHKFDPPLPILNGRTTVIEPAGRMRRRRSHPSRHSSLRSSTDLNRPLRLATAVGRLAHTLMALGPFRLNDIVPLSYRANSLQYIWGCSFRLSFHFSVAGRGGLRRSEYADLGVRHLPDKKASAAFPSAPVANSRIICAEKT
jgi:hypothetical protein